MSTEEIFDEKYIFGVLYATVNIYYASSLIYVLNISHSIPTEELQAYIHLNLAAVSNLSLVTVNPSSIFNKSGTPEMFPFKMPPPIAHLRVF